MLLLPEHMFGDIIKVRSPRQSAAGKEKVPGRHRMAKGGRGMCSNERAGERNLHANGKAKKQGIVFHIDVNSAYLSWEAAYRIQHGDPLDLRNIPSIVGGDPAERRGIVLAKSIPAKKFGIKTGEAVGAALHKCPDLMVVKPRYTLYKECSEAMIEVLKEYSPQIQQYSIDECFLDYKGMKDHFPDPITTAHKIKKRIFAELGFTVNIGISTNKLLAKMASELKKPDKIHTLFPEEVPDKMWCLPVEELFMVGRATAKKLHERGIFTIRDLARYDKSLIKPWLKSHGVMIWNYANGIECSPVKGDVIPIKGVGNSTTIPFDICESRKAHLVLLSLAEKVSARLRQTDLLGEVLTVSLKTDELDSYSHQKRLELPTNCTDVIYQGAVQLFEEAWKQEPLRHLGIRLSELCSSDFQQLTIHDGALEKKTKMDQVVDQIRKRYGSKVLIRSCFLHADIKPMSGGTTEEDYPMMSSVL